MATLTTLQKEIDQIKKRNKNVELKEFTVLDTDCHSRESGNPFFRLYQQSGSPIRSGMT
ncbi:MAG: hypothetical protein Q8P72_05775 [Candidatus Roizmanbacteria bacterium]|nr:hypothetical protein [Candidatus Roizmanbacteria bacterium]